MDKILLELEPAEVQRMMGILLDEDAQEALAFMKECLEKKLRDRMRPHCAPVCEANYHPREKDPVADE
ncbi:MAG: hypothetical protein LDL11_05790 [Desulfarculus sp.]|nr:hypothetical protein [Desulfarculus sp.]